MMDNKYDCIFVGAGPSTMFGVLELIDKGYKGKILIVEKGKSLKYRQPTEVISGVFGAGTFSDSKLTSALDVGGVIPKLTQKQLEYYEDIILNNIRRFKSLTEYKDGLDWEITRDFDTSNSSLHWNQHKTCHVGTDIGQKIYYEIEKFISSQPNVSILTETEVVKVEYNENNYIVEVKNGDQTQSYTSTNLILATGQKSTLPSKIIEEFNLDSTSRAFQLGIRVVDEINPQYEDIIKANYDFKFVKEYLYDNVKVRVRTFCCNSGNAHVCAERAKEGFTCFNGHSYKISDPNNHSVNYGIMCEVDGLENYSSKESQIELMKKVNSISTWESDNFNSINEEPVPKRKLLDGFDFLKNYYPQEILDSLKDFTSELNKLVDLDKAYLLYPEIKLSGEIPNLNYTTFETKQKGLYMIGDCAISRGIIKSSLTGIMFADNLIKEKPCY